MLKPIVDFFLNPWNAPIWLALAGLVAGALWLYERRTRSLSPQTPAPAAPPPPPLSTADAALIERVLAACAEQLGAAEPPGVDDGRAMLRAALGRFLRGGDLRGRRVATLLAERHTHAAQDLAFAIAEAAPNADAWLDASAVAALNDARAAIVSGEKARALGARSAAALSWLGRLYLRRGRLGEAVSALEAADAALAHEEKLKRAGLLACLADVALKRGDRPAARAYLEAALANYADAGEAGAEGVQDARARLARLIGSSATGDEN
ncbi:MAG: hypothetical protein JNJ73_17650 [Hyphomonadaceae bacterium]|nr:hypothetical protein [Hyphomonadaceae bacterium]